MSRLARRSHPARERRSNRLTRRIGLAANAHKTVGGCARPVDKPPRRAVLIMGRRTSRRPSFPTRSHNPCTRDPWLAGSRGRHGVGGPHLPSRPWSNVSPLRRPCPFRHPPSRAWWPTSPPIRASCTTRVWVQARRWNSLIIRGRWNSLIIRVEESNWRPHLELVGWIAQGQQQQTLRQPGPGEYPLYSASIRGQGRGIID